MFAALLAFSVGLSITAYAQESGSSSAPLSFQAWKDQQVLEAQNQILRASARLSSLKSTKPQTPKTKELANGKLKVLSESEATVAAEKDLKIAKDSLEAANALKFEDYVEVYLPTLHDAPEALQKLAEKFSKEELTTLVKSLVRQSTPSNAKRNAALLEGLTVSVQSKNP